MESAKYLAIDIGAGSGRHIIGYLGKDGELVTDEVYRFPNAMDKDKDGRLIWNGERLFSEVKNGIKVALQKYPEIQSLAIDTWGVDYALIYPCGKAKEPIYAYRDGRGEVAAERVHKIVSFEEIYASTGEQYQPFNTIYQLYDDKERGRLENIEHFLMIPEYLSYRLTGNIMKEYTNATTGGFVNAQTKKFDMDIIKKLGLPEKLFEELHYSGEVVGNLTDEVQKEVGGNVVVKLCPSHDTACAFESVPSKEGEMVISSGTWSLVGVKIKNPDTSKSSMAKNFANEGGVGYFRYLKNITGMWLNSCLKNEFGVDFPDMVKMAQASTFEGVFDVNDKAFTAPESMSKAIENYFVERGESAPATKGDFCRAVYLSLANSYLKAKNEIEEVLNIRIDKVYILGGGAKNDFLNDLAKKCLNVDVIPMPIEATAIGNLKSQIK